MITYDKLEIKETLTTENVFDLLIEMGGEPEYTSFGILSSTICHNLPGDGSRKLYYYENSKLFQCYTGCDSFDIFELVIKTKQIQFNEEYDLNDAVIWIAKKFGISSTYSKDDDSNLEDWKILNQYDKINNIEIKTNEIILKEYNPIILTRFNYDLQLTPWLEEGITQEVLNKSVIGYYLGGDQITIPHFDKNDRFIGLRGRTMCAEEAERYGKYRPIKVNNQLYNHPLSMNLYNLNKSKNNISLMRKAIVFESEKSCLKYQSYFGIDKDISVACCGSNISNVQIQLLMEYNVEEIIIAFDRQFQEIKDDEFNHLKKNLLKLNNKYKNYVNISFMFDKNKITSYKASPIDEGPEKFLQLYKERIIL